MRKPPKTGDRILSRFLNFEDYKEKSGDFEELFSELYTESGIVKAYLWFWLQVFIISSISSIKKIIWSFVMFKNYLKIALRNINKNKGYSFINIFGLAVGVASTIFIAIYVFDELSYDRYHENADRIYRVAFSDFYSGIYTSTPLAGTLVNKFPEVETAARLFHGGFPVIRSVDKVFSEERFCWVDSNFFEIFSFEFIRGDSRTALNKPNTIVITESMAEKYFGDKDPIGELLNSDNSRDYLVTGVIKDVPLNSHFHFDFFASFLSNQLSQSTYWGNFSVVTYIQLYPGQDWKAFNSKFPDIILQTYHIPLLQEYLKSTLEEAIENSKNFRYFLQPLTDIHLNSNLDREIEKNSDITYVYLLSIVAFIILFISSFNFINLSTARSANRGKEVGIRKTIGSRRSQFIYQFLLESSTMSLLSVILAVFIVYLALPTLNSFIGKQFQFDIMKDIWLVPLFVVFAVFIGMFSGIYPAFVLASFKPTAVLRGDLRTGIKSRNMRNVLVILQFGMSIFLIISTLILYSQLDFMFGKDLGYDKEELLVIHKVDDIQANIKPFKNDLLAVPNILNVTNSGTIPNYRQESVNFYSKELGKESFINMTTVWCDYEFLETYGIKLQTGGFYTKENLAANNWIVIINDAAVKALKMDEPIGKEIVIASFNQSIKIVGVVKDFNYESLTREVKPMIFACYGEDPRGKYITCRINAQNTGETIERIQELWAGYAGKQAFEYTFLSDDFASLYQSEERTGKLFVLFSILAIGVACIGLFGLIALFAQQRTKEIGIRKVLGAKVTSLLSLFMKQVIVWIIVSNIIAWPCAYYVMDQWLQNFAYRTDMSWWIFVLSGAFTLFITLLTVISQISKAAIANPVDSLRYE
ncbi:MAG: FtsX-like permease family protein [bacterium]|nr:FtsX-like permease family protein [bacterium]